MRITLTVGCQNIPDTPQHVLNIYNLVADFLWRPERISTDGFSVGKRVLQEASNRHANSRAIQLLSELPSVRIYEVSHSWLQYQIDCSHVVKRFRYFLFIRKVRDALKCGLSCTELVCFLTSFAFGASNWFSRLEHFSVYAAREASIFQSDVRLVSYKASTNIFIFSQYGPIAVEISTLFPPAVESSPHCTISKWKSMS